MQESKDYLKLDIPLDMFLAKSWQQPDGSNIAGRNVYDHCLIVANVARELLKRYPNWIVDKYFPLGSALVAGCHDIGKISPTFQKKIYDNLANTPEAISLLIHDCISSDEQQWGGHAGVSQVTLDKTFTDIDINIHKIAGQHHGFSPNVSLYKVDCDLFGGKQWLDERIELVKYLQINLNENFPPNNSILQPNLLAGLTTVSDWIGSGELFNDPNDIWADKINLAIDNAGFINPKIKHGLSFEDVFGFPPHETQSKLIEVVDSPGVYILEAPMGLGKTEAALYAAYSQLSKQGATGIYFALPTQLTSEKIHERVGDFLSKILQPESLHLNALLMHSKAWMNKEMGEDAKPGGAWFTKKKSILAPFAVGTIDQVLLSVLNVKHNFIRTFGLMGKVVILDEVHTYDAYTGTIMDSLIAELRSLSCTVIILSATLSKDRREKLINHQKSHIPHKLKMNSYPLITGLSSILGSVVQEVPATVSKHYLVQIKIEENEDLAFEEALRRAEDGQYILWIENTIDEAQDVFAKFGARSGGLNIEIGLLHSRFTQIDRQSNEAKWVNAYGKPGHNSRGNKGMILVGTQVLEQSLDIDADFLVTKIAPTDMLLQRLGRLWRHNIANRNIRAKQEAWIIAPSLDNAISDPDKFLGGTAHVYSRYVIFRTLEVWQNITSVSLPNDIRELIEATYTYREEIGVMARDFDILKKREETLKLLALNGLATTSTAQTDESVQTRYTEEKTVEVLLVKSFKRNQQQDNLKGTIVEFLNNKIIFLPHNGNAIGAIARRILAADLYQNTVKVQYDKSPKETSSQRLSWLKDYMYLGGSEGGKISLIQVGIVGDDENINIIDDINIPNDKYVLAYNLRFGYRAEKR